MTATAINIGLTIQIKICNIFLTIFSFFLITFVIILIIKIVQFVFLYLLG